MRPCRTPPAQSRNSPSADGQRIVLARSLALSVANADGSSSTQILPMTELVEPDWQPVGDVRLRRRCAFAVVSKPRRRTCRVQLEYPEAADPEGGTRNGSLKWTTIEGRHLTAETTRSPAAIGAEPGTASIVIDGVTVCLRLVWRRSGRPPTWRSCRVASARSAMPASSVGTEWRVDQHGDGVLACVGNRGDVCAGCGDGPG